MFNKFLPVLEIATAVVVTCLVAFQLYKITEDHKTKKEWFNAVVNAVLDEVIKITSKDEEVFRMSGSMVPHHDYIMNRTKYHIHEQRKEQILMEINLQQPFAASADDKNDDKSDNMPIKNGTLLKVFNAALEDMQWLPTTTDTHKYTHKRVLIENMTGTLISFETPMEERLNKEKLESLLAQTLRQHGLNLGFGYEVRCENDCLLFGNPPTTDVYAYTRRLFPDDPIAEHCELSVYFPKQSAYIYKMMGISVFLSLALLIVVMVIFFGTLRQVFRQKKIAQMRSDFVSNMTHELKTPITTILLASEMQKSLGSMGNRSSIDLTQTIHTEAKKLLALVEQVLLTARYDSGKLRLKFIAIDAHELIRRAVDNLGLQTSARGAQIDLALTAAQSGIMADELHFVNIISNLIDNALKYSDHSPMLRISTRNGGKYLIVDVADNGIGMSEAEQLHIFEQFFRVNTGNLHNVKGFGLGLSYVKKIVEAHGGAISVSSKIQKGSVFTIKIPLAAA